MLLENKVAIVTGAVGGIGKDIAMLFAREGARVVIADLNQKGADAVAAELGAPSAQSGSPSMLPMKRRLGPASPKRSRSSAGFSCD